MRYQLISMKIGKDANKILKAYPKLKENFETKIVGGELFVTFDYFKDLTTAIKQNIIVCHDEDVIHIYDEKLK